MSETGYPPDPVLAFWVALVRRDLDAMRKFAQGQPDLFPKLREQNKWVVCDAARRSSPEATRLLIELGAPINQQDSNGLTGLWCAVVRGRYEVAKVVLECGADPNLACPIVSVARDKVEDPVAMAKLLLDHGADINQPLIVEGLPPRTALSEAIEEGRTDLVRFLESRGAKLPGALPGGRKRDAPPRPPPPATTPPTSWATSASTMADPVRGSFGRSCRAPTSRS